jgi:hypothetical protein
LRAIQKAFFSDAASEPQSPINPMSGALPGLVQAPLVLEGAGAGALPGDGFAANELAQAGSSRGGSHASQTIAHSFKEMPGRSRPFGEISVPERVGAALLIAMTLLIGIYPRLLLDWIEPAIRSPLLEQVLKAGDR